MLARLKELPMRLVAGVVLLKARASAEKGQTMVEYGLILALIAIVVIGALVILGGKVHNTFNNVANTISD